MLLQLDHIKKGFAVLVATLAGRQVNVCTIPGEDVQEGARVAGEPSEVRKVRGHVKPHLSQRCISPMEPQGSILLQAHLRMTVFIIPAMMYVALKLKAIILFLFIMPIFAIPKIMYVT